jgi:hypothetical protein
MALTYTPIATQTVSGTSTSTITFSSIPATYTDLVIVFNGGVTTGSINLLMRYNGDTASNYSNRDVTGDGSAASSHGTSNSGSILCNYFGYLTADQNTNILINVMNYSNATTYKTNLTRSNNTGNGTAATVGMWRNTAAINSIALLTSANNFSNGSTFSLYGIAGNPVYTPSSIPASLNVGDQIYIPYTGSATTLSIPAGVNTCKLEVFGAGGGNEFNGTSGGEGGYANGVYTLGGTATTVYAYIGGQGTSRTAATGSGTNAGGFNGGGNGFWASNDNRTAYASSGGGGATDFRIGGTALANRVIVGGGGGGAGGGTGGNGQFSVGANGTPATAGDPFSAQGGFGGTASAGGAGGGASSAGSSSAGNAGSLGIGGAGGADRTYGQGGGGGGGYYGGGGGGTCGNGTGAAGGGGSSYIGGVTSGVTANGLNSGNGYAVFTKLS